LEGRVVQSEQEARWSLDSVWTSGRRRKFLASVRNQRLIPGSIASRLDILLQRWTKSRSRTVIGAKSYA